MTETGNTYDPLKRAIDIVGAATLLVLTVPIQLAAAAGLYATEGGPALFRQERVGRHDRVFTMYKFRTMRPPTDPEEDDADRITALGRVLRSTSIDELPQLWHVLRGQMSLIGPRPLHPRYLPRYSPHQARRHEIRPGITGLAQVKGRNAVAWETRFDLDVDYVNRRSLPLDLQIVRDTLALLVDPHRNDTEPCPEFLGSDAS
ncbi:sugar transferase [Granulicoccus phenolivorans]|uniref:sugar transferase n=1 Tax=Granulicoccus phenolivorans TaxID=266854 RepID=UPI0003FA0221|nr:sugar transferase [Granulicoccus phenolivorans]